MRSHTQNKTARLLGVIVSTVLNWKQAKPGRRLTPSPPLSDSHPGCDSRSKWYRKSGARQAWPGGAARLMPTTKRLWDNAAPSQPSRFWHMSCAIDRALLEDGPNGDKSDAAGPASPQRCVIRGRRRTHCAFTGGRAAASPIARRVANCQSLVRSFGCTFDYS